MPPKPVNGIQRDIDRLSGWGDTWLMKFNIAKCVVHRTKTGRDQHLPVAHNMEGQLLSVVDKQNDLGGLMRASLKRSLQCANPAIKATADMRGIRRAFVLLDEPLFGQMFPLFIRLCQEFAVQVWRPWLQKDIQLLQRAQRRSKKTCPGNTSSGA